MVVIRNQTRHYDLGVYRNDIVAYYEKTLKVLKREDRYDVSLVLVGPRSIRKINREYRKIDRETDVISFALQDEPDLFEIPEENTELGDIFINYDAVIRQAEEYGHSVRREYVFLFVHGLLHLFGYDHMTEKDEKKMFGLQKRILGDLK